MKKIKLFWVAFLVINLIGCYSIPIFAVESNDIDDIKIVTTNEYNPSIKSENSRSIIGDDNRFIINTKTSFPYSAIAHIKSEFSCGCSSYGNGFMVSKNCMLTAGHRIICSKHGDRASTITAYFGYESTNNYYVKATATPNNAVIYHNPAFTGSEKNYDYGYVVFNTNIGNTTGWFGLAARNDTNLDDMNIAVTGYDFDSMYKSIGTITSVTSNRLKYDADTDTNSSGSPVYGIDGSYNNKVVAIHTMGTDILNWKNSGWRITVSFINELQALGYVS